MGSRTLLQVAKEYWESLPEKFEGKKFYLISTDEVYGALELTHPEDVAASFTTMASSRLPATISYVLTTTHTECRPSYSVLDKNKYKASFDKTVSY